MLFLSGFELYSRWVPLISPQLDMYFLELYWKSILFRFKGLI